MSAAAQLPERYRTSMRAGFDAAIAERLQPGIALLDIGSGRHPALKPEERPSDVRYVGFDLSRAELEAAGPNAYDEMIEADAATYVPELAGQFDLIVSWQVLEHIKDLEQAIENARQYLREGGRFVAQFSGAWSVFGVINRILPDQVGAKIVDRTMKRTENNLPVFPAFYDRCTSRQLAPILAGWSDYELVPHYAGASYFNFLPPLRRLYLVYENAIARSDRRNLATHYLLIAER